MVVNIDFNNLTSLKVIDSNGSKIGRIKDALINKRDLSLKGLVILGSFLEEKLEDLKIKKDIDPIISLDCIIQVSEQAIILNKSKSDCQNLAEVANQDISGQEFVLFSKLREFPVTNDQMNIFGGLINFYINNNEINYQFGGKEFIKYLQSNYMTENLSYIIHPTKLKFINRKFNHRKIRFVNGYYQIQESLKEIERNLKLNMTNVIRDLLVEALKDGKLSEDEKHLINAVTVDLTTYNTALELAYEDRIITKEEEELLDSIREKILKNIHKIALSDTIMTSEERSIILKFASFMIDRRSELFWKVFGSISKKNN